MSARVILRIALLVAAQGCAEDRPHSVSDVEALREGAHPERTIALTPRTPYLATYPCGEQCHDARIPDPTPRTLEQFHAGRVIRHGPALHWCDDCHSIDTPDRLALLDGTSISFDASDALCAQCHGERHREWTEGMHGLTTGGWRGPAERRLCTACHDPHAPDRIQIEALPPPALDPRLSSEGA